jgi:preprotein translocase subunit SecD
VFYERLKDEVRDERSVRSAVERGWVRARRTILSADAISLLAAVILYAVSIGDVRGFAFTLGLSTFLDLFVVFFWTKPLVTLAVRLPLFSTSRISGLSPGHAGISAPASRRRPAQERA